MDFCSWLKRVAALLAAVMCSGLLCFCGMAAEAEAYGETTRLATQADEEIPTFRFRSSVVEEWLLLGPVSAEARPSDPVAFLGEVAEGKEVEFSDGTRRNWTRGGPREFAYVALDQFCKTQQAGGNQAVVYAFCNVIADATETRQFFHGADDHSRVWADDELVCETANGWYSLTTASFGLNLTEGQPASLLVEAQNGDGDFGFGVASGRTWEGVATFANRVSPSAGVLVQLRDLETDAPVGTDVSDPLGRLSYAYVPYEVEVGAFDGSNQLEVYWTTGPENEQRFTAITSTPPLFDVVDLLPRDYMTSHPIAAIDHCAKTGEIYFVDSGSPSRLRVLAGQSVGLCAATKRLPETVRILEVAVSDNEEIYLHTLEHGLLIFSNGARMQFGAAEPLEGFTQVPAPAGIYVRPTDKLTVYDNAAWVMAGGVAGKSSGDAVPTDAISATRFFRVASGAVEATEVVKQDGMVHEFYVGPNGFTYGDAFALYHRPNPLSGPFEKTDVPATGLRGIGYDAKGRLSVLGWQTLAVKERGGDWQAMSLSPRSHMPGDLRLGADAWVCTTERVFRARDGQIHSVAIDGVWESSASWEGGGLLVGTVNGRIFGVQNAPVLAIGTPDGLISDSKCNVECSPHGVILSGKQMPLHTWDGEAAKSLRGSLSKIGYYFDSNHILRLPSLVAFERGDSNTLPYYYTYHIEEDKFTRVSLPTDVDLLAAMDFVMRGDGTGLLATNVGLFELGIDTAKLESHQDVDAPFSICSVGVLLGGEVWIGSFDGKICRLKDSSEPDRWISIPKHRGGTRITQIADAHIEGQDVVLVGTTLGLYVFNPVSGSCKEVETPFGPSAFIQDIELSRRDNSFLVSVRNMGVYKWKNGVWARLELGQQFDTTTVWDIEVEQSGEYWLTTDNWFMKISPVKRDVKCFADRLKLGDRWASGTFAAEQANLLGPFKVECDGEFGAELSVASPIAHAGFRFRRAGDAEWQYLPAGQRILEASFSQTGPTHVEVQAFDHDHNFSAALILPVEVYLPWWRSQVVRFVAAMLLVLGIATTGYSVHASRRSRIARRQAEQETIRVEKARRALAEESTLERERLLLRVCHDLKNPLNVVFACTEMLTNGELAADEAAPLLNGSAASMDYLSKQLLSYSKAKRAEVIEKRLVTVNKLVEDLRRQSNLVRRSEGCEIDVDIQPEAPRVLNTDAQAVKEVLSNLLDNAIKHCPRGKILLSFVSYQSLPTFVVQDSGPGIAASELESIFNAFYQSEAGDGQSDGLGLGLAICKTLAERLGGELHVESEPGHGARFSLMLPSSALAAPADVAIQQRVDDSAAAECPSPHFPLDSFSQLGLSGPVLVVDDQEYVGTTIVQLLGNLDIEAKYVGATEAVEQVQSGRFLGVMVDLNMPGRNGFSIARELRQHCGDSLRIIAMSESEQLVELAGQFEFFDRVLPKSGLFEMLGRSKLGHTDTHQETV